MPRRAEQLALSAGLRLQRRGAPSAVAASSPRCASSEGFSAGSARRTLSRSPSTSMKILFGKSVITEKRQMETRSDEPAAPGATARSSRPARASSGERPCSRRKLMGGKEKKKKKTTNKTKPRKKKEKRLSSDLLQVSSGMQIPASRATNKNQQDWFHITPVPTPHSDCCELYTGSYQRPSPHPVTGLGALWVGRGNSQRPGMPS